MPVAFKPERYGVTVITRWPTKSGKWIVFLGTHWDGKDQCWDVGFFCILNGETLRQHFKGEKARENAMLEYDGARDKLSKVQHPGEDQDEYRIINPN